MEEILVKLVCVKEGRRLRVRITSRGYNHEANCQFPRAIRVEGRTYSVPASAITFSEGPHSKFFYRVNKKHITFEEGVVEIKKVFGDEDLDTDCAVCMCAEKDVVFAPCGHYCCCQACADTIFKSNKPLCVLCREPIKQIVKRDQIQ